MPLQTLKTVSRFRSEQTKHSYTGRGLSVISIGYIGIRPAVSVFVTISPISLVFRSLQHSTKALHKFGSGHRSNGVCDFLFLMVRSAPLAAKKQAIVALAFLSACYEHTSVTHPSNINQTFTENLHFSVPLTVYQILPHLVAVVIVTAYDGAVPHVKECLVKR